MVIEEIEGDALKNARAALTLPPGMVREGESIGRFWTSSDATSPTRSGNLSSPFGYYEAQASSNLEKTEDGQELLRGESESRRARPGHAAQVRVTGPGEKNRDLPKLVDSFPLKPGDALNQVKYEKAKEELRSKALNLGYLGSDFASHVIRVNRAERKAEIELILQTGSRYLFGEVIWEGTQLYPISYLERFLDFKPGEPYSYSKVYQTQLNLINSDRFASVNIRADKDEAREGRVPVRIQLEPSAPKRLRPGVGYSTDYGAKLAAPLSGPECLSAGPRIQCRPEHCRTPPGGFVLLYPSQPRAHRQPDEPEGGASTGALKPYDNLLFTLEGEQARSFGYGIIGSAYLQFRYEQFSEADRDGSSELFMPGLRLYQRRVDDLIRPGKGFRYSLETRGSTQALGAESNFLQFLGNGDLLDSPGGGFLFDSPDPAGGHLAKGPPHRPAPLPSFLRRRRPQRARLYLPIPRA